MRKIISIISMCFIILGIFDLPVYADQLYWPEAPDIYGQAAILIDAETGAVLYEKNADDVMYPASITKVVTAIVAIENASLEETVTFSKNSIYSLPYDAARIGIVPGEEVNLLDCLYVLVLRSANEVANGLAEHVGGSEEEFAKLMNEYAKEAGAENTNFVNPSGLHDDNHYTTARDFAKIAKQAIKNDVFCQVWGEDAYRMPATNKNDKPYSIWHRHNMIVSTRSAYDERAIGGKTGTTGQAGSTLVTHAKYGDLSLISVVLKSNTDNVYKDTKKLLDYGFTNFERTTVSDETFGTLLNSGSFFSEYNGIFKSSSNVIGLVETDIVIAKGTELKEYERKVSYSDTTEGGILANIEFFGNGKFLGSVPVKLTAGSKDNSQVGPSVPIVSDIPNETNKREVIEIKYVFMVLAAIILLILFIILIIKIAKKRKSRRYNYVMSGRRIRKRYKYRRR
ncbi:MAG: D-alanyl-D-alanine carboxypeptidase [Lachnospiraceae bacterium]|nr:D-alanyl-D-alanine carboxypeptidase [Lachnospiraceae bacterium]